MTVFCNASFASIPDPALKLGLVLSLVDAHSNANIFNYRSVKPKRVIWSVIVKELFATVHAFDCTGNLSKKLNNLFSYIASLILYTDSKSLLDSVVRLNATMEKRLLIDLIVLRQSYE